MQKRSVTREDKKAIIERISFTLREDERIIFAYIFGSFSREEYFSDIDIGIYLREVRIERGWEIEFDLEDVLQSMVRLPIDVRVLNFAPVSFVYAVIHDGIIIVDKDSSKRADYEGMIFKKYFDFSPFRWAYLAEVVNAPI